MNRLLIRSISGIKSFETYKALYSDQVVGYTMGKFLNNIRRHTRTLMQWYVPILERMNRQ